MGQMIYGDREFETYAENGDRFLVAPGGCPECAERVQPGHSQCEVWPEALAQAEQAGRVQAVYVDQWRWLVIPALTIIANRERG